MVIKMKIVIGRVEENLLFLLFLEITECHIKMTYGICLCRVIQELQHNSINRWTEFVQGTSQQEIYTNFRTSLFDAAKLE